MKFIVYLFLFIGLTCFSAEYWVSTNGNNSNPGSQALPWLTVAKAGQVIKTNDIVYVLAGTYDEKVTPSYSGTSGTNVTYKGVGMPVIRGFDFTGKSNWSVIGFHFYHPTNTYAYDAIYIARCMYFKILDNYFESINATHAVISSANSGESANGFASYGLIRSNVFYKAGLTSGNTIPAINIFISGTNNLVEYNDISQGDDFTRIFGKYNIVRNNYFHDCQPELYSNQPHVDGMQTFDSTNIVPNFDHNLMECNLMVSNSNPNGHLFILQNQYTSDIFQISDFVVRKNVAIETGDSIGLVDDAPNVRVYNNTIKGVRLESGQYDFCIEVSTNYSGKGTVIPTNFVAINNIFHTACLPTYGKIFAGDGVTGSSPYYAVIHNNLTYLSGSSITGDTGGSFTNVNPVFVGSVYTDVYLTNTSPCIGGASKQTTTIGSGVSASVVAVVDAGFFSDGWGISGVTGDSVIVGTNSAAVITGIDYSANTITLSRNITWLTNEFVSLYGTQDIGAYAYDANGYYYNIFLTAPAANTSVSGLTTLSAIVMNPNAVREVRWYLDGIEIASCPPSNSVTVTASIVATTNNIVQARAYALNADSTLVRSSQVTVNNGTRFYFPFRKP